MNVKTYRLATTGTWDIDARSTLEFGLSYEHQSLFHPIVYSPFFSLLIDTRQRTYGGMLRYRLTTDKHTILAGLNLAQTANRGGNYANAAGHRGLLQDTIDTRATSARVFLMDHWALTPDWTLVYGAQGVTTHLTRCAASLGLQAGEGDRVHGSGVNPGGRLRCGSR